jgi:hypothetical protein
MTGTNRGSNGVALFDDDDGLGCDPSLLREVAERIASQPSRKIAMLRMMLAVSDEVESIDREARRFLAGY